MLMNEEGNDEVVCACPLCGQSIPSKKVKKTKKDLFGHTIVPIGLGFLVAALVTECERIMEEKRQVQKSYRVL